MKFKVVLALSLLALVMMIASEVAARDLAETETNAAEKNGLEESMYHGGGGGWGGGGGGRGGWGGGGGGRGGGGGWGGGGGGYCRWGCCGHGYHGGCRCCKYAGENAVESEPESKPQN